MQELERGENERGGLNAGCQSFETKWSGVLHGQETMQEPERVKNGGNRETKKERVLLPWYSK
jgi:hypothetical protein